MSDEGRLQDLEDIRTMKATYIRAFDTRDLDGIVAQFSRDGVLSAGRYGEFKGIEAISDFYADRMEEWHPIRHYISNPLIEFTGPDTAKGEWYLMDVLIGRAKAGQVPILYGTYSDLYVREDGQWKMQLMKVELEFPATEEDRDKMMS